MRLKETKASYILTNESVGKQPRIIGVLVII